MASLHGGGLGLAVALAPTLYAVITPWEDLAVIPLLAILTLGVWNWALAAHLLSMDRRVGSRSRKRWWVLMIFFNIFAAMGYVLIRGREYREKPEAPDN